MISIEIARYIQLAFLCLAAVIELGVLGDMFRCWFFGLPPFGKR